MKIICLMLALVASGITSQAAPSIVGAWSYSKGQERALITFFANGVYTMGEIGNSKVDPSGRNGMERGTYKWNAKTKKITTKTKIDTSREWGLSHAFLKSASVKGNKLTLVAIDGKFKLSRVKNPRNPIIGSWFLKEGKGYAVATFLDDGTYYLVQDGRRNGGGRTGVEFGTYKWNAKTKVFKAKERIDTNGSWGFSDDSKSKVSISGKKLTMDVKGDGKFVLSRVSK